MAYTIQSWLRAVDLKNNQCPGEEVHRAWRVLRSANAGPILSVARKDFAVCRVTLTHSTSATSWDLYRTEDRDRSLDSSLRQLAPVDINIHSVSLDVAAGVSQAQMRTAIGDMLNTVPGDLGNS
jgi:acetolactate synthase regulatory subunit